MPDPRPGLARWLRMPRLTARLRLTVLFGATILACGGVTVVVLVFLVYGTVFGHATHLAFEAAQRAKAVGEIEATIAYDRKKSLIASGIGVAVIAVAAAAIGWFLAAGCCAR